MEINNGEWVQGSYFVFMGKHYIFEHPFESDNLTHQKEKAGYMITFLEKQKIRKIVQLQEIFLIIHS